MTQDEIIEMAREAGLDIDVWKKLSDDDYFFGYSVDGIHENLEAFAKLVTAKEREKFCALLRQFHDSISLASDSSTIKARGKT